MTAKVIETKRQPPLWSVKAGNRHRAVFSGTTAREQAEAYATANYESFEVMTKRIPAREQRRLDSLAER